MLLALCVEKVHQCNNLMVANGAVKVHLIYQIYTQSETNPFTQNVTVHYM